jgi:divalent metal cation (Fe/Co/Zn/Cd) transporter
VGLVLAALGLFLEQVTGSATWDGVAAIAIGVLLLLVAGSLARANVSLLIGQSVPPAIREQLRQEIAGLDQVVDVPFLLTSVIGPGQLVVAAKVDFADDATVADVERASDEAERRLVARHQGVRYVFLDPTPGDGRARAEAHRAG